MELNCRQGPAGRVSLRGALLDLCVLSCYKYPKQCSKPDRVIDIELFSFFCIVDPNTSRYLESDSRSAKELVRDGDFGLFILHNVNGRI